MNLSVATLLVFAVPVLLCVELIRRRFGAQQSLPVKKTVPSRQTERMAESLLLGCVSLVIWLFMIAHTPIWRYRFHLVEFYPPMTHYNIWLAAVTLLLLLIGWAIAWRWSTGVGSVVCGLILIGGLWGASWLDEFISEEDLKPRTMLSFYSGVSDLKGADLYVNGVHLGEIPLSIERSEFLEKVPVWEREHEDPDFSIFPDHFMEYSSPYGSYSPKACFQYEPLLIRLSDRGDSIRHYYAQLKYQGQWCYWTGSGGGGGGSGRYLRERGYPLNFLSIDRDLQIETLLDQARLQDYQVSDDWFGAMKNLGRDGIITLLKNESGEPGLTQLLQQWTTRQYGLEQVQDETSAWQAFEDLCQSMRQAKAYSTEALEGRAVAWLAPMLPVDKLTRQALKLLDKSRYLGWTQWSVHGQMHFGFSYDGARLIATDEDVSNYQGVQADGQCPIEGYMIAHALWLRFKQGDPEAVAALQDRIVPAIMAKYYEQPFRYSFLCAIGGETLERFLYRQDWQADAEDLPWEQRSQFVDGEGNSWFRMLASLDTPMGRQFRREHCERIFSWADSIASHAYDVEGLYFLFLDPPFNAHSLPRLYWPRFEKRMQEHLDHHGAEPFFEYLLAMEPQTPVALYAEVVQKEGMPARDLVRNLDCLRQLPLEKRQAVCEALVSIFQADLSYLDLDHYQEEDAREDLLAAIDKVLLTDDLQARQLYDRLSQGKRSKWILKWLQYTRPDHELVTLLAQSDQAELRVMALPVIAGHPIKRNRELLQILLEDADESIRQSALEVKEQWRELAEQSPLEIIEMTSGGGL